MLTGSTILARELASDFSKIKLDKTLLFDVLLQTERADKLSLCYELTCFIVIKVFFFIVLN